MDFYIKRHLNFHKNISYSIQFYITHDSLWKNSDGENGFLTTYIRENSAFLGINQYSIIKNLFSNVKEQLNKKSFIIIPITIRFKNLLAINTLKDFKMFCSYKISKNQIKKMKKRFYCIYISKIS